MARGKKPTNARDEATRFAGRMGYHWVENPEPDLPFDFLIYRRESVRAVKVLQVRNRIDPDTVYDNKYPGEMEDMRSLPLPPCVFRELWLKTRGEKIFRRLLLTPAGIAEIESWEPDGYTNPHVRKEVPVKPGPTGRFIVSKIPAPRLTPPDTPAQRVREK